MPIHRSILPALLLTACVDFGDKDDDDDPVDTGDDPVTDTDSDTGEDTGIDPDADADGDGWTVGDGDCDDDDAEINPLQFIGGKVDVTKVGTYHETYFAEDASGNRAHAIRTVMVEPEPSAGVLTLLGEPEVTHEASTPYVDAGATLVDGEGKPLAPEFIRVE